MAKITKQQSKMHIEAMALVKSDLPLSFDEIEFIFKHYNPMAQHMVGLAGIYFTPVSIAREMRIETMDLENKRTLDLCAGIGILSYQAWKAHAMWNGTDNFEIVCIENNPEFVEIGKRIFPQAKWVCGDAFDRKTIEGLGKFDQVLSNPPYGIKIENNGWLEKGLSQYKAAEVAMKVSNHGIFILAQGDCPFKYSGINGFERNDNNNKYKAFNKKTGIVIEMNCGIDISYANNEWAGLGNNVQFEIAIISKEEFNHGESNLFSYQNQ